MSRICLWWLGMVLTLAANAQKPILPDSLLRNTLERAVQHWQAGKATDAYLALDTITSMPTAADNASTKVKAALWTANYLMAQKKMMPAKRFLDSALTWGERFSTADELRRSYEVYSDWHLAAGNPKTAMVAREAAWKISDSLRNESLEGAIDSLRRLAIEREAEVNRLKDENSAIRTVSEQAGSMKTWVYILGGVCALLLVMVFLLNGNLQRLRKAPPAPLPQAYEPSSRPAGRAAGPQPAEKLHDEDKAPEKPLAPAPKPSAAPAPAPILPVRDIVLRLKEVELVLINADTLSQYQNGETRPIRNLLNEYMAQLPFIMKTLDDAITKNDAAPILLSLEHLKPYIQSFGMQATHKLIEEIEEDAHKEKVSKLLSRVFQVRNHCRRAADESKALIDRLS